MAFDARANAQAHTTLRAVLYGIVYYKDGFLIGNFMLKDRKRITAKGSMIRPEPDIEYELSGYEIDDERWGRQFVFTTYRALVPEDDDGVVRYLLQICKGILTPATAKRIVKHYDGAGALDALRADPGHVATSVRGLSREKALAASEELLKYEEAEAVLVELQTLLALPGIRKSLPMDLYQAYGTGAVNVVRENPYALIRFDGVGFLTADKVALAMNFAPDSVFRQRAAVLHVLQENEQSTGGTWMPRGSAVSAALAMVEAAGCQSVEDGLADAVYYAEIAVDGNVLDFGVDAKNLALGDRAYQEETIARKLARLAVPFEFDTREDLWVSTRPALPPAEDAPEWCPGHWNPMLCAGMDACSFCGMDLPPRPKTIFDTLTSWQRAAVETVRRSRVSVLCGGPGTGKTYTLQAVLEWARQKGHSVAMAAPTGKAAKRMSEATGFQASTIHRLLEPEPTMTGGFRFGRNHENPIPHSLLILDETSMVDTWLLSCVMEAVNTDRTAVLFVGDEGQLPSVGPGAVLRDIIASGAVPVSRLTEVQRNAGDIVRACHAIAAGGDYRPSVRLDPEQGMNLRHIEQETQGAVFATMLDILDRMGARGYDKTWDVQFLSPVNEKTDLSCKALNTVLREKLNPGPDFDKCKFRPGDKVIFLKNTMLDTPGGASAYVVNGDMGVVLNVPDDGKSKITVRFFNPDREVLVPRGGDNLQWAYCITCHKAQGSEAPVVIIPVHPAFGFFVDRCWIYTAISRARDICVTVGQFQAVRQAVGRVSSLDRKTGLAEALRERFVSVVDV